MAGINAGGIGRQLAFRPAGRFEEFPPLDLRKAAATIDHIGERGLLHRLAPMFLLNDFEQRRAKSALQPAAHHRERCLFVVEMRHQFARKMRRRLGMTFHEFLHHLKQLRRTMPRPR